MNDTTHTIHLNDCPDGIATIQVTWTDEGDSYRARIELASVKRGGYLWLSDVGGDAGWPSTMLVYPVKEEKQP